MKTEYEVVFSSVNRDEIREKIKSIGGKCTKVNTLMRRVVFENPENPTHSYLRVRDEGGKVTCCLKVVEEGDVHVESVKELETQVDDFETMQNIFLNLGIRQKSYQETYREIWELSKDVEIMIDQWPGLKPFIEIEGPNKEILETISEKLGFDYSQGIFGTVDQVYKEELGLAEGYINQLENITFENSPQRLE